MTFLIAGAKEILKATQKNQSERRRICWHLVSVIWEMGDSDTGSEGREQS